MKLISLALAGFLGLFPLAAEATVYKCDVNPGHDLSWITEVYWFEIDDASGKLEVIDGLIKYFVDKPVEAKVLSKTDKKLVFSWSVFVLNDLGQRAKMNFRSTLFFDKLMFRVAAKPQSYLNDYEGYGTCAKQ